ncbi:hypothetical protein [Streptomyces sp. P17]|uniref:hypothetical protein n=1 Tax=Streptomyces sp. P17 TaxID=3074716 RepID=UPI0028F45976|nr:hypothetical protein [Streptomyces sp. P17]MDT9696057.1 hypothetical protein [Streptomyces sp. P17]
MAGLLLVLYVDAGPPPGLPAVLLVPMALGCALTVPPLTAATAGLLTSARQLPSRRSCGQLGRNSMWS